MTVHCLDRDVEGRQLRPEDEVGGVRVRRWPARAKWGYYTTRFEPNLGGDIVHLHGFGLWTHDWIVRHGPRVPEVVSVHHGVLIPTPTPLHRAYHWWHRNVRARRTMRGIDLAIVNQPVDRDRLVDLGYPAERIRVLPEGVPQEAFQPSPKGHPPDGCTTYYLYLGRLHPEKSIDHAMRALARCPTSTGLIVAGPDEGQRARLEQLAQRLGVERRVTFEGRVDDARKRSLLGGARALVLPSRYESLGLVVLESWAQGRPVIAARVGGIPFLVDDGADGILHEWGDTDAMAEAMRRLQVDGPAADAMGAAGRRKAEGRKRGLQFARIIVEYTRLVQSSI